MYIKGTAQSWQRLYTGPYWDFCSIQAQKRTAHPSCGASSEENKAQRNKATGLRKHGEQGHKPSSILCEDQWCISQTGSQAPRLFPLGFTSFKAESGPHENCISSSSGLKARKRCFRRGLPHPAFIHPHFTCFSSWALSASDCCMKGAQTLVDVWTLQSKISFL